MEEQINQDLNQEINNEVQAENSLPEPEQSNSKKVSPTNMALCNLLLYGLSYLLLHRYKRFFVFFLILILLGGTLKSNGILLAYIIVMVDSYLLAKKVKSGKLDIPPKNSLLTVLIVLFILLSTILSYTPKYYLAFSEKSCDFFYPVTINFNTDPISNIKSMFNSQTKNRECKSKVLHGETLFTFFKSMGNKIEQCEQEKSLKDKCYFYNAVQSKNYEYCFETLSPSICIRGLAQYLNDKSICQYSEYNTVCEMQVETYNGEKCENVNCAGKVISDSNCCIFNTIICQGISETATETIKECNEKYFIPLSNYTNEPSEDNQNTTSNKTTEKILPVVTEKIDSDGDGLTDVEEKAIGTNINIVDTDKDGLNDASEVNKFKTDPLKPDTDGDGYADGEEVKKGYDPLK